MTAFAAWTNQTLPVALPVDTIHLWAWRLLGTRTSREPDLSELDPQETDRCLRFHYLRDRANFAVCHRNMRHILAAYLHQPAASLVFTTGQGGKPCLRDGLQFNLSHCAGAGMLAVAWNIEVGIDVEAPRPVKHEVATRYFSKVELQQLAELSPDEWPQGFLRCWTRKEALLKAEGVGLRIPLNAFDVSLGKDDPLLLGFRSPATFHHPWKLYNVAPWQEFTACLAAAAPPAAIHRYYFQAD